MQAKWKWLSTLHLLVLQTEILHHTVKNTEKSHTGKTQSAHHNCRVDINFLNELIPFSQWIMTMIIFLWVPHLGHFEMSKVYYQKKSQGI